MIFTPSHQSLMVPSLQTQYAPHCESECVCLLVNDVNQQTLFSYVSPSVSRTIFILVNHMDESWVKTQGPTVGTVSH